MEKNGKNCCKIQKVLYTGYVVIFLLHLFSIFFTMRKLTLQEWAKENFICLRTATNRFNEWRIKGAVRNDFNKIVVYLQDQDEIDREAYKTIYWVDALSLPWENPNHAPMAPLNEKKTWSQYVKKTKKEIIPSTKQGNELAEENINRCLTFWLPYRHIDMALNRVYYGGPENVSKYLDEYERNKVTIATYIGILQSKEDLENQESEKEKYEKEKLQSRQPAKPTMTTLEVAITMAESKDMDYDYIKYFFEKIKEPKLLWDDVIIDFLEQLPAKNIETYATDIVIANRSR